MTEPDTTTAAFAAAFHAMGEMFAAHPAVPGLAHFLRGGANLFHLVDPDQVALLAEAAVDAGFTVTVTERGHLDLVHGPATFSALTHERITVAQARAIVANTLRPNPEFDYDTNGSYSGVGCRDCGQTYSGNDLPSRALVDWAGSHDCDRGRVDDPEQAHADAVREEHIRDILAVLASRWLAAIAAGADPAELAAEMTDAVRAAVLDAPPA